MLGGNRPFRGALLGGRCEAASGLFLFSVADEQIVAAPGFCHNVGEHSGQWTPGAT